MGLKESGVRNSLRNVSVRGGAPDITMFQDPLYQWWAGVGIGANDGSVADSWTDRLASILASAVGGPLFQESFNGFDAVEYDGIDDAHNWVGDAQLPTGSSDRSFAALIYTGNTSDTIKISGYGNASTAELFDLGIQNGNVTSQIWGLNNVVMGASLIPSNQWITVGSSLGGGNDLRVYLNGSEDGSTTTADTANTQDANHAIGYRRAGSTEYFDGYIAEVILTGADESGQAFSDYHQDRLG